MKKLILTFLLLSLVSMPSLTFSQVGADVITDMLEESMLDYQDLEDLVSMLPDHILMSDNELSSKSEEVEALYVDVQRAVKSADKAFDNLESRLDTYEANTYSIPEDRCPELDKKFAKLRKEMEPLKEKAESLLLMLDEEAMVYDEKKLVKVFKDCRKLCSEISQDLEGMISGTLKVMENCGDD